MFADIWGQPVLVYMAAFNAFDGIVINGIISSSKYNLLDPMQVYTDAASTFYTTRTEQPHLPINRCSILLSLSAAITPASTSDGCPSSSLSGDLSTATIVHCTLSMKQQSCISQAYLLCCASIYDASSSAINQTICSYPCGLCTCSHQCQ